MNLKKYMSLSINCLALLIVSFLGLMYSVNAGSISDSNNPGSGKKPSDIYDISNMKTAWASNDVRAVRVRVFRDNSVIKDGWFYLSNSQGSCKTSTSGLKKICTTTGYDYPNTKSKDGSTCSNASKVTYTGCMAGNNLYDTIKVSSNGISANGVYLNNYLKKSDYANLRKHLKQLGYDESDFQEGDFVIIEPATTLKYNDKNKKYFGTINAFKKQQIGYSANKAAFKDIFDPLSNAFKIKESSCDFNSSSKNSGYSGCGYFKYNVSDFVDNKLTIVKKDEGTLKGDVLFTLTGNGVNKTCKTAYGTGSCTFYNLFKGTYTLTESVPSGYDSSVISCNGCKTVNKNVFTVEISSDKTVTITNKKTCKSEFSALGNKTDPVARVNLYQKYGYRNLLDFNNVDDPCNNPTSCKDALNTGCLSSKFDNKTSFSSSNMACYDETITVGSLTGYCGVTFDLNNNLNGGYSYTDIYSFGSNFKSGQMVLNRSFANRFIAQGRLNKTCYVYGNNIASEVNSESNQNYSDYVNSLELNGETLKPSISGNTWNKSTDSSILATFAKNLIADYELNSVYASNGAGLLNNIKCDNNACKLLGYGFASILDKEDGTYSVPFTLKVDNNKLNVDVSTKANACTYSLKREIVEPPDDPDEAFERLNLEFRIIDTTSPFPGKGALGRKVGTNWCVGDDCTNTNSLIKDVIIDKNNSFNRTKEGPIYIINLTPSVIQQIREYNSTTTYDDYTLKCEDGGINCKSTFLTTFNIKREK